MDDEGRDELDDFVQDGVLEQEAHLYEAAAAGEVDTPLLLRVVLVIDLHIADALEQQRDQEVLVLRHQVKDLPAFLQPSDLHFGNGRPEFDTLRAYLRRIILGHMGSHCTQSVHISAHSLILLPAYFHEALHGRFPDLHLTGSQRLIQDLVHDKVALLGNLEVRCGIWNRIVQSLDCQFACFRLVVQFADVVRQCQHDRILQLVCQILRLQLLTDIANRLQRSQLNLLVLM